MYDCTLHMARAYTLDNGMVGQCNLSLGNCRKFGMSAADRYKVQAYIVMTTIVLLS